MALEHLISTDFTDWDDETISVGALLGAQAATTSALMGLDADGRPKAYPTEVNIHSGSQELTDIQRAAVQHTFANLTSPDMSPAEKKASIIALRAPPEVRHLANMLTAYDWEFVHQAKELRGYVVAKLLEETKHADPRIRLRSLELVGKLTEVGSFTERIEITKKTAGSDELMEKIRAKLDKLTPRPLQVEPDVETIETLPARVGNNPT